MLVPVSPLELCLYIVPFLRYSAYYWSAIASIALCRTIFELFDVK